MDVSGSEISKESLDIPETTFHRARISVVVC